MRILPSRSGLGSLRLILLVIAAIGLIWFVFSLSGPGQTPSVEPSAPPMSNP